MINKRKISQYRLRKATEHIYYEVEMFFEAINKLQNPKDQSVLNVYLDVFVVHLRNLINFLYPKKDVARNTKQDDIIINDYVTDRRIYNKRKTKKQGLKRIIWKSDKQVCHLTYARNKLSSGRKGWNFRIIGHEIHQSLSAFYFVLPNNYKKYNYFIALKKLLDGYIKE